MNRKELKQKASQTVRTHWGTLVLVATIALVAETALGGKAGNFLFRCVKTIQSGADPKVLYSSMQVIGWILAILLSIFFLQVLRIVSDRMFLEAHTYEKVPLQHVFYLTSVKKWFHTALAYFRRCLYLFLWSLTVIGGIIKYYSYFLVGFILAENPSISGKDAVKLSRKMMDGHKWEAFVLQLSMLPWYLLSIVTLNIAGWLYVNPYVQAVYSEYYIRLRNEAKEKGLDGVEQLNDTYLFEKADDEQLQKAYKDLRLDQRYVRMNEVKLNGLQSIFNKAFGLWIGSEKKRRLYQGTEDIRLQTVMNQNAMEKSQYPFRLSPLYERRNAHYEGQMNEKRAYTLGTYMFAFVLSAFIGWLMQFTGLDQIESSSVLRGPWVLWAGCLGLIAMFILGSLREKPVGTYIGSVIVSAVILYFFTEPSAVVTTGGNIAILIIESLECGLGVLVLVYGIMPYIDAEITVSRRATVFTIISIILLVLFIVDAVTSASSTVGVNLFRMLG